MSNLIVDIGNTKTKLYIFVAGEITEQFVFLNEDETGITKSLSSITYQKSIISATAHIPTYIQLATPKALILHPSVQLPFQIRYETPNTLGTDRIALTAGAALLYPDNPILIIDAGTCITYDFLDKENIYHGGAISPGLTMRLQSLHTFTDKLPLVPTSEPFDFELIGRNTRESIQSGVYNGMLAEIDGMIDRYMTIYKDLTVLLSGGDADLFALHLKNKIFAHSNLQALGLNHILENNAK